MFKKKSVAVIAIMALTFVAASAQAGLSEVTMQVIDQDAGVTEGVTTTLELPEVAAEDGREESAAGLETATTARERSREQVREQVRDQARDTGDQVREQARDQVREQAMELRERTLDARSQNRP
ncbi:hypothetical protein ACHHRT_13350 [Desulfurivibrio sp. D14AmB]|uniref:hypothetical protein n=1 Tax=Desulfurivibrio sp. D14AmB TaxID=3374370 RepID=UPI00376EA117